MGFAPPADAEAGVHRARLRIVRSGEDDGPPCDMSALVTTGTDMAGEPPLQPILETLGYASDLGPAISEAKAGGEAMSGLFQHAKTGNVGLYVVARYSQDENSSYGIYSVEGKKLVTHLVPSGVCHPGKSCVLGDGMVIDPHTLLEEMEEEGEALLE